MRETAWAAGAITFIIIALAIGLTIGGGAVISGLLLGAVSTGTTTSPSGMEIYTGNGERELTLLRGCSQNEILKLQANDTWGCDTDSTQAGTGSGVVSLDLADDDVNESDALDEIAITNDTNSIFTEPSPDKLLIDAGQNWPSADTANALSVNPTDCAASNFANAIDANANLTCAQVDFTDLSGTATDAQIPDTITIDNAATADALTANGANCSAGEGAGGVNAAGAAEDCTDYADVAGDTFTGDVTFSGADLNLGVDCSSFSNGGTLSTTGSGVVHCQDDDRLNGGRSLTVAGLDLDADAELYTVKKSINIVNPTTSETNLAQFEYPVASTITEVSCSTNTGTVTIQFDERARATPNSAGTDVMTSSLVCDTDSQTTSSFTNAAIAADVPVNLQISSTSGTPGVVRIHVEATKDD